MALGAAWLRDVPLPISGVTSRGEDGIWTSQCSAGFWGEQGPQDAEAAPWPCSEGCPPAAGGPRPAALSSQGTAQLWAPKSKCVLRSQLAAILPHQILIRKLFTSQTQLSSSPSQVRSSPAASKPCPYRVQGPETFSLDWGKRILGPTPFGFSSCIWSFQAGTHRTRL